MEIKEIKAEDLDAQKFIAEKVEEISSIVGNGVVINALSGGVDSSTVTMLGHKALGNRLKTYFIDNGLMRKNEPEEVALAFEELDIPVEIFFARGEFLRALVEITDPEEKREAVRKTFYKDVFGNLVKESGAKHILQGTIFTDIEETVAGIKRQHNIFAQLGIDPKKTFGYQIIEPLQQLRKDGVRKIAEALGLPEPLYNRMPFPGPALATRIIGEVTLERVAVAREATAIVEEELAETGAFQYLAVLHQDRVTGMRDGKRDFGMQIEVRCWDSIDARTATPTRLAPDLSEKLVKRIITEIPGVVSVTYNATPKPPSTIEAI
jgi:GMP synthase (glutamine-hydrolysing)